MVGPRLRILVALHDADVKLTFDLKAIKGTQKKQEAYENYRVAKTIKEAIDRGASWRDIKDDLGSGIVVVSDYADLNEHPNVRDIIGRIVRPWLRPTPILGVVPPLWISFPITAVSMNACLCELPFTGLAAAETRHGCASFEPSGCAGE